MSNNLPNPEQVSALLTSRRTVHDFTPQPVTTDILEAAIDCARWAPNHYLTEPWRIYCLGKQSQQAIAKMNAELVRAKRGDRAAEIKYERWLAMPGWFVLGSHHGGDMARRQEDYAACCCAAHNISLSLWSAGVGVKWTTGAVTQTPEFFALLGLDPTLEEVVGLFWYGYARSIGTQQRRDTAAFVSQLD